MRFVPGSIYNFYHLTLVINSKKPYDRDLIKIYFIKCSRYEYFDTKYLKCSNNFAADCKSKLVKTCSTGRLSANGSPMVHRLSFRFAFCLIFPPPFVKRGCYLYFFLAAFPQKVIICVIGYIRYTYMLNTASILFPANNTQ